ncbi:MAG: SH3 beta-barrel fold-containing protein [Candidatus Izemoplasma sp.]
MTERNWNNYYEFCEFWYQTTKEDLNSPNDAERMRKELKPLLASNIMLISFKKANSSKIRCMKCTLIPEHLPEKKDSDKKENLEVQVVMDLEAKAFRSFRYDCLIDYTIEEKV